MATLNSYLTNDLNGFNSSIEALATEAFEHRKQHLLKKNDLISALGVPIRQSASIPSTFAIPTKRTKAIAEKPKVTEKGYIPEPALDETIYGQIIKNNP